MTRLACLASSALAGALLFLSPGASLAQDRERPPIVFVHGDSDTAALWQAQMWRFASNGYPADLLYAVDIDNPSARADDAVEEENRSA